MARILRMLLHWWRLAIEPSGYERLLTSGGRWRVRYAYGASQPMHYDMACDYAKMFNGTVERAPTTKD